jgi:hypothetical protein
MITGCLVADIRKKNENLSENMLPVVIRWKIITELEKFKKWL